jgi:hypothetical protein
MGSSRLIEWCSPPRRPACNAHRRADILRRDGHARRAATLERKERPLEPEAERVLAAMEELRRALDEA